MATPNLNEVKSRAKALTDDPQLQGYIDTAVSVEAVESMLSNSGFSSFEVSTVTRDDVKVQRAEEDAVRSLKEEVLESIDDDNVRAQVKGATSIAEVKEVADAASAEGDTGGWLGQVGRAFEGWVSGRTVDRVMGWTPEGQDGGLDYQGNAMQRMTQGLSEMQAKDEAAVGVDDIIQKAIAADIGLSRAEVVAAYTADDVADAINIIYDSMYSTGATPEQLERLGEAIGEESVTAAVGTTMRGDAATEAALEDRIGYEGDFAENHEFLIENGWYVQVDADDNLFYINPQDNTVLDIAGDYSGEWSPISGDIEYLTRTDARAPIGITTGQFGTAETGALNVNAVAGRPTVSLNEWFELYGTEFTDVVTGHEWEDVLKKELGAVGMQSYLDKARTGEGDRMGYGYTGAPTDVQTELHYQYLAGEDVNMFIDMPIEQMTEYQQKYEAMDIGYKAKKYGRFDQHFIEVVNKTMRQANWDFEGDPDGLDKVLADMANDPSYASNLGSGRRTGGGTSRVWRPPAYLAPDYAELSQAVKATFETKLGRAPSDAEISLLSKKMGADHRSEFDAQAQAQKLQFFGSGGTDAGTVQDVNYAARFQEDFEERHQDELGTLDKIEQSRSITQNALGSILQADRAAGY